MLATLGPRPVQQSSLPSLLSRHPLQPPACCGAWEPSLSLGCRPVRRAALCAHTICSRPAGSQKLRLTGLCTLLLPRWLSGKEPGGRHRGHKRPGFDPWVGKIPWGRAWQRTPVFLPGDSHRQKSLAGHKESDRTAATEHTHTHISLESPIFILSIIPAVTTRGQIEMHVGVAVVPQQRHLGLSPRCLGQVPRVLAPVRV